MKPSFEIGNDQILPAAKTRSTPESEFSWWK